MNIVFGERKIINKVYEVDKVDKIYGGNDQNTIYGGNAETPESRVNQMFLDMLQTTLPWSLFSVDTAKNIFTIFTVLVTFSKIISSFFLMIYVFVLMTILQTCHDVIQAGLDAWHKVFKFFENFFQVINDFSINFDIPDIQGIDIPDINISGVELPDVSIPGIDGKPDITIPNRDTMPGFSGTSDRTFSAGKLPNVDVGVGWGRFRVSYFREGDRFPDIKFDVPNIPSIKIPGVNFKPLNFFNNTINDIQNADKLAPLYATDVIIDALKELFRNLPGFFIFLFQNFKNIANIL